MRKSPTPTPTQDNQHTLTRESRRRERRRKEQERTENREQEVPNGPKSQSWGNDVSITPSQHHHISPPLFPSSFFSFLSFLFFSSPPPFAFAFVFVNFLPYPAISSFLFPSFIPSLLLQPVQGLSFSLSLLSIATAVAVSVQSRVVAGCWSCLPPLFPSGSSFPSTARNLHLQPFASHHPLSSILQLRLTAEPSITSPSPGPSRFACSRLPFLTTPKRHCFASSF